MVYLRNALVDNSIHQANSPPFARQMNRLAARQFYATLQLVSWVLVASIADRNQRKWHISC